MTERKKSSLNFQVDKGKITNALLDRAKEDLVFKMDFLGESQHLLFNHFRELILQELKSQGLKPDEDPLLGLFAEAHAAELRDFVFTGVSLQKLLRFKQIEELIGVSSSLMLVDIWDTLEDLIDMAEKKFAEQAQDLPDFVATNSLTNNPNYSNDYKKS
ncbi:MAG: hypothetical protein JJ964_13835 [Rhizobiales bacterium]|nr:hypothetical protein [Hyphomicrobiales bacterium]